MRIYKICWFQAKSWSTHLILLLLNHENQYSHVVMRFVKREYENAGWNSDLFKLQIFD